MSFTISAAALRSGVSVHTLRYYERIGLLAAVDRNRAGRRVYSSDDLDWIQMLRCLRISGMPISEMSAFGKVVRSGGGIPERIQMLSRHKHHVKAGVLELQKALEMIYEKLARYGEMTGAEDCSAKRGWE